MSLIKDYAVVVMKMSVLCDVTTHTGLNIAPSILPTNEEKVRALFGLCSTERILILRNFLTTSGKEKFLVVTDLGVYQNFNGYSAVPWDDLSEVLIRGSHLCFMRNVTPVIEIEGANIMRISSLESMCRYLSPYCIYSTKKNIEAIIEFKRQFTQFKDYCRNYNSILPWLNIDSHNRLMHSNIDRIEIPDSEFILLYRKTTGLVHTQALCITDQRIYISQDSRVSVYGLSSINSVEAVQGKLIFSMRDGNSFTLAVNNIIMKLSTFLNKAEVNSLAKCLSDSLSVFFASCKDDWPKVPNKYPSPVFETYRERHRCPFCGSLDIHLAEDSFATLKQQLDDDIEYRHQLKEAKSKNPLVHVEMPSRVVTKPIMTVHCMNCQMTFRPSWMDEVKC